MTTIKRAILANATAPWSLKSAPQGADCIHLLCSRILLSLHRHCLKRGVSLQITGLPLVLPQGFELMMIPCRGTGVACRNSNGPYTSVSVSPTFYVRPMRPSWVVVCCAGNPTGFLGCLPTTPSTDSLSVITSSSAAFWCAAFP